jgi:hypothetical protein
VFVSGVGIDLPVVAGPSGPPLCNVAMYYRQLSQPMEPGVTMIFAHARKKMFLPLLSASQVRNGASLIGRVVYVYTSDSKRYAYRITRVLRHQRSIDRAFDILANQLWLQTSEGPYASSTKLVIVAAPFGSPVNASYAGAHPTPHPLHCAV